MITTKTRREGGGWQRQESRFNLLARVIYMKITGV